MIERKFVTQSVKEFMIQEYIKKNLPRVGHSYTKLIRTPLGEKILICASRPGLVVGKEGSTITKLTKDLKERFNLENPQIELIDVENPHLDASIVSEMIANSLEQFGVSRFKGVAHKALMNVMNAGAYGVEILIGGKVPSARAKTWRFFQGYIKKCGDVALTGVNEAYTRAELKTGTIGIQVRIMPPTTKLPDDIIIKDPANYQEKPAVEQVPSSEEGLIEKDADGKQKRGTSSTNGDNVVKAEIAKVEAKPKRKSPRKKTETAKKDTKNADKNDKEENSKHEKKEKEAEKEKE